MNIIEMFKQINKMRIAKLYAEFHCFSVSETRSGLFVIYTMTEGHHWRRELNCCAMIWRFCKYKYSLSSQVQKGNIDDRMYTFRNLTEESKKDLIGSLEAAGFIRMA